MPVTRSLTELVRGESPGSAALSRSEAVGRACRSVILVWNSWGRGETGAGICDLKDAREIQVDSPGPLGGVGNGQLTIDN